MSGLPLLEAAQAYASGEALGRIAPVFPLVPGGKLPLIPRSRGGRGVLDATADREQIAAWWSRWPEANIGIGLAGARLVVLDVEGPGKGFDPRTTIDRLEAALGALPETLTAGTAGGGEHRLHAVPSGANDRPSTIITADGEPIPGCERRRAGHYIVAAPSRLADGARWRWLNAAPIAPAPAWLVPPPPPPRPVGSASEPRYPEGAHGTVYGLAGLRNELAAVRATRSPHRHSRAYYAAVRLGELEAAGELDGGHARTQLLEAAEAAYGAEWPGRRGEIDRTVVDGFQEGAHAPRARGIAPPGAARTDPVAKFWTRRFRLASQ